MRIINSDDKHSSSCTCCEFLSWIIFLLFIIFFCLCLIFNILCYTYDPYDNDNYNELISNWEKTPITSISINKNYLYSLNRKINEKDSENIRKMFVLERMDDKYNYKYLLNEKMENKDYRPCGTDFLGNYLYLPYGIECPINDIEISTTEYRESNLYVYKTIKIYDNLYLHYTNYNIDGQILNDININISDWISSSQHSVEIVLDESIFPLLEKDKKFGFFHSHYEAYSTDYSINKEKRNYFKYAYKAKSYRKNINIWSFILLIIIAICFCLLFISKKFSGLNLLILFLLLIEFYIKYTIIYYLYSNDFLRKIMYIDKYPNIKDKYDLIQLIFITLFILFYLIFYSISEPQGNFYFLLIYIFRYGLDCDIFIRCINKNNERKSKKLLDLDKEIEDLNKNIKDYAKEKDCLIKEKRKIEKKIIIANESLDEKRKKNESELNGLYFKEEEITFETELENLLVIKKSEIEKYNRIKEQIEEIDKNIYYYRLKQFNKQINDKPLNGLNS